MRRLSTLFISMFLSYSSQSAMAGGWGAVFAIELRGDGLEQPIEITDPSVLERLSFWVGPGTNMTDFMRPDGSEKSIVDWDASVVCDEPADLQRIEVKFRMGRTPESWHAFFVLYGMEPDGSAGYIYYPHENYILTHFSEGTWRHATDRWNETIGPIVEKHTTTAEKGEFSCRVPGLEADGRSCWPERPENLAPGLTAQRL